METQLQQQIETLQELRQSLLSEETVMWDEVNAVERDLKFLLGTEGLGEDKPYAAEDAAVAMLQATVMERPINKEYWDNVDLYIDIFIILKNFNNA